MYSSGQWQMSSRPTRSWAGRTPADRSWPGECDRAITLRNQHPYQASKQVFAFVPNPLFLPWLYSAGQTVRGTSAGGRSAGGKPRSDVATCRSVPVLPDAPDPRVVHPIPGQPRVVYLAPLVDHPKVQVGDYTYYDHPERADRFAEDAVLYAFGPECLLIGRFCAIVAGVRFLLPGANHADRGPSTFPFGISLQRGGRQPSAGPAPPL